MTKSPEPHFSAVRFEESVLSAILDNSDDCIQILDRDLRLQYVNPGGLPKLGIAALEKTIGAEWLGFWEDDSQARAKLAARQALEGTSAAFLGTMPGKDGAPPTHWDTTANPIRDSAGKVCRLLVTSRDVTEQTRAAAERSRPDANPFELFVEGVKDYALFLLDPSGRVKTWNEGARLIKGYEATEIIGRHFSTFYTPEDLARSHPAQELAIAEREGRFEEEGWRVKKDGSRFWASVVISRVSDPEGKLVGFAKVTRDLTGRRLAEQARQEEQNVREREQILEQVYSKAPCFMALLSVPDFRYLRSNEQYQRLIRRRDIIGKKVADVMPEMEAQEALALLREVARTGEPYVGHEVPIDYAPTKDSPGKTSYLEFVYQPLRKSSGEIYAVATQGYDVTEKVLFRKAVDNERENFRKLFEQTPEMVCILRGPRHVFEFVNEAHVKALGFNAVGMSVREAQPESVEVHGILDEVYRTGETAFLEEIPVTVGGRLRHFNLTYSARRDDTGRIDGIMILGTEITDLIESSRRLEQLVAERTKELRESGTFLDSVIENLPNMVFVKDAKDLRFVRFNRAGEHLLGVPRSELLGRNDFDLFPREQAEYFVAKDREVLRSGTVLDVREEPIDSQRLGRRILHTRKIPILGLDGQPEYLLGISEDITEWKQAEEQRMRVIREEAALAERNRETARATFLADASTVLARSLDYKYTLRDLARLTVPGTADWCTISIVNDDGDLESLTALHEDPAKAHLAEELLRHSRIWPEASLVAQVARTNSPRLIASIDDALLARVAKDARHLELLRGLGVTSTMIVPIPSRGRSLGVISFAIAGADRRYNENDLAMAIELGRRAGIAMENASLYESAQRAVRTRDEFMSIASHELKTPLTSLKLQAQIRERDLRHGNLKRFAPENLPKLVAEDEKQLNRLIRLVEDMLDVSRINTGKITFAEEEFDFGELVRDTAARYSPQFDVAGVPLEIEAAGGIVGRWDRFRVEQVFVNLLMNALKYGNAKPVSVTAFERDGHAVLVVKDQGSGIPRKDQERIFEQFERAVPGTNIAGLGLGLFISRKIIEAHHGRVTVDSTEGQGSTFTVELPLRSDSGVTRRGSPPLN